MLKDGLCKPCEEVWNSPKSISKISVLESMVWQQSKMKKGLELRLEAGELLGNWSPEERLWWPGQMWQWWRWKACELVYVP